MRVTLLYNPSAGDERHSIDDLVESIAQYGHDVRTHDTHEAASAWLQDSGDLVVVAGGDGSVKRAALALAGSSVPLTVIPVGTANNIARSLGMIGDARQLISRWPIARRMQFDVGRARVGAEERDFLESAGIGLFPRLLSLASAHVDNRGAADGRAAEIRRAIELLDRIAEHQPAARCELDLDGEDLSGEYLMVEAMNIRTIGPRLALAPDADPGDGALDVVLLAPADRSTLLHHLRLRLEGDNQRLDLPVRRGRTLRIRGRLSSAHLDDDEWRLAAESTGETFAPAAKDVTMEISLAAGALTMLSLR